MVYVKQMLRRYSSEGQESLVFTSLLSLPSSLHELYEFLLDECGRNCTDEQFETLKAIFVWLAYAKLLVALCWGIETVCSTPENVLDRKGEISSRSPWYAS